MVVESLMKLEITELKKEVRSLKQENKDLSNQLEQANAVLNNFKQIFTAGQIRKMVFPSMACF